MSKLFGTDGIRGIANEYPVTADLCVKLAIAAGREFVNGVAKNPRVIIAKDTRLSGYLIEYALTAGFMSIGMEVILVGPMPTPAVSMLVRSMRADLGVMVSASHNPYQYNGIKFFNSAGEKISTDLEKSIEGNVASMTGNYEVKSITGAVGRTYRLDDAQGRYIEFLKTTFDKGIRLDGLKIVIDAANGSAYKIAPTILWELGAEVVTVSASPNGLNINDKCGAIYPRNVATEVLRTNADLGIALDGDADRVVMCDENGQIIDGDKIIAFLAINMKKANVLFGNNVVMTEMSNLALDKYLSDNEIQVYRTSVGDKFVYGKMCEIKSELGGECSGHIILNQYNKTGDGMVAALNVLSHLVKSKKKASYINELYSPYPRVLKNLEVEDKSIIENKAISDFVDSFNKNNEEQNRLLVRASGTEPVIRILAEGLDEGELEASVNKLCYIIYSVKNGKEVDAADLVAGEVNSEMPSEDLPAAEEKLDQVVNSGVVAEPDTVDPTKNETDGANDKVVQISRSVQIRGKRLKTKE